MLVLDNNVLSDYLTGTEAAEAFLRRHEDESWAISSIVLYEAMMGATHGFIGADPETIRRGITNSMDVLDVTDRTASEANAIQAELQRSGVLLDHPDALIAASAREHGGAFATAEKTFWDDDVRSVLDIVRYDPSN